MLTGNKAKIRSIENIFEIVSKIFDINEREIDKYLVYHSPFDKLNN